jgi:hypothetical protein
MSQAVTRVFVSHSTQNAKFVDPLVERLRDHYIATWYAPRHMPGGYFAENIRQGVNECDWFLIVLSPDALTSDWVRKEVELAMCDPRFYNRVIPLLAAPCDWKNLHPHLGRYQLFDFVAHPKEAQARLLRHLGVEPHTFPPLVVGDVKMPDDWRLFVPSDDVVAFASGYLAKRESECHAQEKVFVNNRQVRLVSASWGSQNPAGGLDNRPLRLTLGWTWYFHTAVTNMKTDERLDDGRTIGQKYAAPIDNLADCRLSNPIAANLSIITTDGFIFYGQRSSKVQTMPGGFQPAVSGDGQPEDLDTNGVYDPFHTACREASEEALGNIFPPTPEDVTFFGLGRWMKTRFPFLFGEIRTKLTAKQLESQAPTSHWEGVRMKMPFTVEAVTDWVADRYRDQYFGRAKAAISSPIFSLLQSLRYEYPTRWLEVIDRLDLPDIPPPQNS